MFGQGEIPAPLNNTLLFSSRYREKYPEICPLSNQITHDLRRRTMDPRQNADQRPHRRHLAYILQICLSARRIDRVYITISGHYLNPRKLMDFSK